MVIGFNTFLSNEGIDPTEVKLVRHQDTRFPGRPSPYRLLVAGEGQFDLYQRIQSRPVFKGARLLASFVATPLDETLSHGKAADPAFPNYKINLKVWSRRHAFSLVRASVVMA